jgi:gluconate 2-dehydrogenase gamma chain
MSEMTRRDMLQRLAVAIAAGGAVDPLRSEAQVAHHAARQSAIAAGGRYAPRALSVHEFATLERLAELIIPAEGTRPGASQADVAPWIDTLLDVNSELKAQYTKGLAWIDAAMKERSAADFITASPAQQTALLDLIAFRKNRSAELDPGIDFFVLARRMTADGFYTSAVGMRDIYPGNSPQASFTVPAASMEHVLRRSRI